MPPGGHPRTNAPGSPDLTALQTIVALLVSVLVNLVKVKFQGKVSPFKTHPLTTSLAVLERHVSPLNSNYADMERGNVAFGVRLTFQRGQSRSRPRESAF